MKKRVNQAVLRIALLFEEFSEPELSEAVELLRQHGSNTSSLLSYLWKERDMERQKATAVKKEVKKGTPFQGRILEIQNEDPEKYEILSDFQERLRKGVVLADFDEMRKFGSIISKGFVPKKSRKETIPALVACMAERPLVEIVEIIAKLSNLGPSRDGGYQELADFIIKGKPSQ